MAVTLRRWVIAALLGCAALVAALLPPQAPTDTRQLAFSDLDVRGQVGRALQRAYRVAWLLSRRSEAVAALRTVRGDDRSAVAVVVDPRRVRALPAARLASLRVRIDSAARALPPRDSSIRVVVFITADSGVTTRAGYITFGTWYALPGGTDGRTCLVVIPASARQDGGAARSPLGPCAFFAAFGMPGPDISRWLRSLDYIVTDEADWTASRSLPSPNDADVAWVLETARWPDIRQDISRIGLTLAGTGCAAGRLDHCRTVLAEPPWSLLRRQKTGAMQSIVEKPWWSDRDERSWFLADLVRLMGRERFARFWRSPLPRDSAFAAAMGMPIEQWTHRWLAETRPDIQIGPAIRPLSVLLGLAVAALLVGGGAYYTTRRQVA